MAKDELLIQEIQDVSIANQLMQSGDYRQPEYDKNRGLYIFVPRKR